MFDMSESIAEMQAGKSLLGGSRVIASALWYRGKAARLSFPDLMAAGAFGLLFRKPTWRMVKLARHLSEIEHVHEHNVLVDHWYLAVLGVEPAFHGKKLASPLLRPFLASLDQSGIVAYLKTMTGIPAWTSRGSPLQATEPM